MYWSSDAARTPSRVPSRMPPRPREARRELTVNRSRRNADTMFMDPEPRIVLVDDDVSVLRGLERLLRVNGFRVEAFTSAAAFLETARAEEPACLILDLSMPG